jgi:serine/threonine-protein kinase
VTESTHVGAPTGGSLVAGRYRLDELAGTGGMAQVWAATDTVLGRRVAIKILHQHLRSDETLLRRFRQEGMLSARLTDPNIVGIYDTVSTPDNDAIVMEYVEGRTLRRRLDEEGRLDPETVVDIGCRVADALDVAHRNGLTHRDIKPANILLCDDGTVKVADFGIAKTGEVTDLTRDGTLVGTATYLAPEQLSGDPTDGRADLYSLGVVLYECLCGRPPFQGDNETARALQRLHSVPVPPHRVTPGISPALSQCVMHVLERDPEQRPGSAGEFRAELADCLEPTSPSMPVGESTGSFPPVVRRAPGRREHRERRAPRRNRLGMTILLLLVGGAIALIVALAIDSRSINPPADQDSSSLAPVVDLPLVEVADIDPEGSGTPGENHDRVGLAHDGDPATAWRTERYQQRDFGTKSGVGLQLRLGATADLEQLVVSSSSQGWSAQVFVLEAPVTGPPTGRPAAELSDIAGDAHFQLDDVRGSTVLLWITELGTGAPRYSVDVAELEVRGRT